MDVLLIKGEEGFLCEFSPRAYHQLNTEEWKKVDCDNVNALRRECLAKGLRISSIGGYKTLKALLKERGEWEAIIRIRQTQPEKLNVLWDNLSDGLMSLNHLVDFDYFHKLFLKYGEYGDD